jgi:hypothetical protein
MSQRELGVPSKDNDDDFFTVRRVPTARKKRKLKR